MCGGSEGNPFMKNVCIDDGKNVGNNSCSHIGHKAFGKQEAEQEVHSNENQIAENGIPNSHQKETDRPLVHHACSHAHALNRN